MKKMQISQINCHWGFEDVQITERYDGYQTYVLSVWLEGDLWTWLSVIKEFALCKLVAPAVEPAI